MKSFLKYTLATIVGIIIVNVLIFFLFIGFMGAMVGLSEKPYHVGEGSVLHLTFGGQIPDRSSDNPLENIDLLSMNFKPTMGLNRILGYIEEAKTDRRISGIYLDLTDIYSNFGALATVEELREALKDFKESGKFVYSYSQLGYSQKSYYLATVADSVFVNPESPLLLTGMSATVAFYKETLDKLGVKPEVVRVGKFKSAVEPYLETKMSEANREQVATYLNSMWGHLVKGIAEERNVTEEEIQQWTDEFEIYTPEEFVRKGLFDGAIYEDEMLTRLRSACQLKTGEKLKLVSLENYARGTTPQLPVGDKIAVIYAEGNIGMQQGNGFIGPELAKTIREAREDNDIKAIVLRVNSPGGSALTSDIIWREVKLAMQEKPFIASMGNVAASGGYYISCAADVIMAEPTTLTGSIGIFGLFFSGEELIKDKIGIHTATVKTNEHSDFGGGYPLPVPIAEREMTPYERGVMQQYINRGYDTFLTRVSEGRGMTKEAVNEIAQGRVWTGADAKRLGLVDELGGLQDAIQLAAERAGLENYQVVELPTGKSTLESLFGGLGVSVKERWLQEELGGLYEAYTNGKSLLNTGGIVARIPYDVTFN